MPEGRPSPGGAGSVWTPHAYYVSHDSHHASRLPCLPCLWGRCQCPWQGAGPQAARFGAVQATAWQAGHWQGGVPPRPPARRGSQRFLQPLFLAAPVPCSRCSLQPLFLAAAVSYSRVTPVASHTGRDEQRLLLGGGFPRPASGSVPARNFQDLRLRISGRDSESQAEIDEKGPGAQAPLAHRGAQTRAAGRCHPRPSWTRRPGPGGPAEGRSSTAAAAAHCGRAARRSRGPQ